MPRRLRQRPARPPLPAPPDILVAPELAALAILDVALETCIAALLAEHMTLIDDFRPHPEDGRVVEVAAAICAAAASLRRTIARYARAARDTAGPSRRESPSDFPF